MNPIIKILDEKKLTGKRINMSFAEDKTHELWTSFMPLRKEIPNKIGPALYSLQIYPSGFFNHFNPHVIFEKWACVEIADHKTVPNQTENFLLTGGLYAVFLYRGDGKTAAKYFREFLRPGCPSLPICWTTGLILNCRETNTNTTALTRKKRYGYQFN